MKRIGTVLIIASIWMMTGVTAWGQVSGDYRTNATSVTWSTASDWETYDGTWTTASSKPAATNSVYIQAGHTATLSGNEACSDLHINSASNSVVALGANTLEVNGKIRAYTGVVGTIPGTSTGTVGASCISSTSSLGKIRFVGSTRTICNSTEWGNNPQAWDAEFAPTAGQTLTIQTGFKARNITISSGTVTSSSVDFRPDGAAGGAGTLTVKNGATLQFSAASVAIKRIATAGATSHFGTLTVESGAKLDFSGTGSPTIGGSTFDFSGTVVYSGAGAQTFAAKGGNSGGADPTAYSNLKLSGSGAKTTAASLTTSIAANGSLEMSGGATPPTFATGSGGTFSVSSTGTTVSYTATGAQTTGSEWDANFQNATINNSSGVSLTAFKSLNGTLTLTSGNLTTTSSNLLTLGSSASVSGGSSSSFVSGPMVHTIAATSSTAKTFPIGKGSAYRPITLTVTQDAATSTTYTAEVFNAAPTNRTLPGTIDKVSSVRYWNVAKGSGANATNASVLINYDSDDGVTNNTNLRIVKDDGAGTWVDLGGTGSANTTGNITSTVNFTSFSDFTLGNNSGGSNPLPVQLTSFSATANRLNAELRWSTATEVRNYGFELERRQIRVAGFTSQRESWDLKPESNWRSIAFIPGAGTSQSPRQYLYIDYDLAPGRYAYRIKQIDNDGTFEYFTSAEVEIGLAPKIFNLQPNYPNPFNPSTKIEFTLPEDGRAVLRIFDVTGRQIATLFEGGAEAGRLHQVTFDASPYPTGIYFSRLEYQGRQLVKKMLLLK